MKLLYDASSVIGVSKITSSLPDHIQFSPSQECSVRMVSVGPTPVTPVVTA